MINRISAYRTFLLAIMGCLSLISLPEQQARAQFLHFEMNIEAELGVEVLQNLDFGTALANSGPQTVTLGDPGTGIFSISGSQSQSVIVSIDAPDALSPADPDHADKIPLTLDLAYNNRGNNDFAQALPISGRSIRFPLTSMARQDTKAKGLVTNAAYIYVYGSLFIGDVPEDTYSGDITLAVEYE